MIERRNREKHATLNLVSVALCFAGILAIAFVLTLRVIQTKLLPYQDIMQFQLSSQFFNTLNSDCQYILILSLVLSGLIVDLIGPRTILIIAITCSIISNLVFHNTHSFAMFMASRFLTEFFYVFTLTSVLTLGPHWLPRRHFSAFVGMVFGTLLIVPKLVTGPLGTLITAKGMPYTDVIVSTVGMLVLLIIFCTKGTADYTRRRKDIYSHFNPLRYYKIWLIAFVAMIGWMINIFFTQLGPYYLVGHLNFSIPQAIQVIQNSFICFGVGAFIMGFLSGYVHKKRNIIIASYCLAALSFLALLSLTAPSIISVGILMGITAFLASSNIICYTKSNDYCTVENSGIAVGLILSFSTIGNSLFVKYLGHYIMNCTDPTLLALHCHVLYVLPIGLLIGALITFLLKPTHHHRPKHSQ